MGNSGNELFINCSNYMVGWLNNESSLGQYGIDANDTTMKNCSNNSCTIHQLEVVDPFEGEIARFYQIISWLMIVVGLFGIPLNLAFMIVVVQVRSMRTIVNWYLVNLSVADTIILVTLVTDRILYCGGVTGVIQFITNRDVATKWEIYFGLYLGLTRISGYVSLFIILMLGIERYNAICKLKKAQTDPRKKSLAMIVAAWLLAAICTVFVMLGYYEQDNPVYFAGTVVFTVAVIIFDISTVTVLFLLIIRKLVKRHRQLPSLQLKKSLIKKNIQTIRFIVVAVLLLLMCMLPILVQQTILAANRYSNLVELNRLQFSQLSGVVMVCIVVNSSCNSLIYAVSSCRYRKAFQQTFGCRRGGGKRSFFRRSSKNGSQTEIFFQSVRGISLPQFKTAKPRQSVTKTSNFVNEGK